jgi:cytochrome P450
VADSADEHLAFGRGRHLSLGAPLARAEIDIALRTLWRRIPDLRILAIDELAYGPSIIAIMLERLDVEWPPPAQS